MNIKQLQTWFVPRPNDEDTNQSPYLIFELVSFGDEPIYLLDGDKLLLSIKALEKDGNSITDGLGMLSQYGGSELLLQMASTDQQLDPGTKWELSYSSLRGFEILPADIE